MHLENLTPEQILAKELPTGSPIHYTLNANAEVEKAENI